MIVLRFSKHGLPIAEITYRVGMHVEVKVFEGFGSQEIDFRLSHSQNEDLKGKWEDALDNYFNEGLFDSKENNFPGEMRRIGSAREHRSLFRQAAHSLMKDLEPHGFEMDLEFL